MPSGSEKKQTNKQTKTSDKQTQKEQRQKAALFLCSLSPAVTSDNTKAQETHIQSSAEDGNEFKDKQTQNLHSWELG
jgi:hypothetical protein